MKEDGKEDRREGFREALSGLVKDGILTLAEAAKRAGLSATEFQAKNGRDEIKNHRPDRGSDSVT